MSACIVPTHLEEMEADGGENHRPQIRRDLTRPPGDTFTAYQTPEGSGELRRQEFTLAVKDPDNQELYVRMFIDRQYDAWIYDGVSEATAEETRSIRFEVPGLCDDKVNGEVDTFFLEIYVSDGLFLDEGQDLRLVEPGGYRDGISWDLVCRPPPTG
jgi:hypothetical protein